MGICGRFLKKKMRASFVNASRFQNSHFLFTQAGAAHDSKKKAPAAEKLQNK
jgi:hypothetical protein